MILVSRNAGNIKHQTLSDSKTFIFLRNVCRKKKLTKYEHATF